MSVFNNGIESTGIPWRACCPNKQGRHKGKECKAPAAWSGLAKVKRFPICICKSGWSEWVTGWERERFKEQVVWKGKSVREEDKDRGAKILAKVLWGTEGGNGQQQKQQLVKTKCSASWLGLGGRRPAAATGPLVASLPRAWAACPLEFAMPLRVTGLHQTWDCILK